MTIAGHTGRLRHGARFGALGVALAVALSQAPAGAARTPLRLDRDVADNGYSFTFNALRGTITNAASSIVFHRGDKDRVRFLTTVRERRAGAEPRLVALFQLTLQRTRAVTYDGDFILKLKKGTQTTLVRRKHRTVTLRPRDGERKATVRFLIEPPSGNYDVIGRYEADAG